MSNTKSYNPVTRGRTTERYSWNVRFFRRGVSTLLVGLAGLGAVGTGDVSAQGEPPHDAGQSHHDRHDVLVVVGAEGAPEYAPVFAQWAELWRVAAEQGEAEWHRIGPGAADEERGRDDVDASEDGGLDVALPSVGDPGNVQPAVDRDVLLRTVSALSRRESPEPLWVVLIGHGTFDGQTAKFNLRGPDISAEELRDALAGARRPQVVINCSSSSGPFINVLSDSGRIVVTATRSGHELNYSRFGGYFAEAISNPAADLDKDDQVSLLEAFVFAAAQVAQYYADENRLATEHALLDDNGDGLGTPAEWFRGVRAVRGARDGAELDGNWARRMHLIRSTGERGLKPELRQRRDELEQQLEQLRAVKSQRDEDDYYREVEAILVEIARIYAKPEADGEEAEQGHPPGS